jgi:trehalose 6-phosphate phosphatase
MRHLPDPAHAAYLLDMDGTLIDIAPTPDQVVVPSSLISTLQALRGKCGDAVAVVTGRPVAQVEALLGDGPYAVAGEHGAALRRSPGAATALLTLPHVPLAWIEAAQSIVAAHPGTLFEPKAHGLVLHYRGAPTAAAALRTALEDMLRRQPGVFVLLAAKMAWEIRARGVDKGEAVRALMEEPPFAGRVPVFVGDDVTDEDGIRAAEALGGMGLRVGSDFADAGAVRAWLANIAAGTFKPAGPVPT